MVLRNVYSKTVLNFIFHIRPVLILALLLSPTYSNAQTYSGPIVITKGGTYTGNWESTNSDVAAVDIRTTEPVVIINSNIRGAGFLIKSWYYAADITVKHTNGYGITPTPTSDYPKTRRFVTLNDFRNLVVENCYMESTTGIVLGDDYRGDGSPNQTIKIRYNKAKNIDGRVYGGKMHAQFVQFNYRGQVPHVEIAWNQVINEPNKSVKEDNINIYNSRGTPSSPIKIHNNYIQGAYPVNAQASSFSGGGILTDSDGNAERCPAFIEAHDNQLVNLGNYSMGIAAGHNIRYHHNRVINSATFDDGTRFNMYTSGVWSKDYEKTGITYSNSIDNNTLGVMAWNWPNDRRDISDMSGATAENNISLPGTITKQHERDEFTLWQQKLSSKGIVVGPGGSGEGIPTTTPAPVPEPAPEQTPEQDTTGSGEGMIISEIWTDIHIENVNEIPVEKAPSSTKELKIFESHSNVADHYGQRIRGYITAPASGQYTFWVAGDNNAELSLSTSEDPAQKQRIAYVNGYTGSREWSKQSSQRSAAIMLEAGKRYYIEVLHVEGKGEDNVAVGWQLPDGTLERPIAGNRLSPMGSATAPETPPAPTPEPAIIEATTYPNPFKNVVVLDMGNQKITLKQVVILTPEGVLKYNVPNVQLVDNKLEINLAKARLNAGMYFLKYTDSTGLSKTIRIIKE
ncbi:PA14 domain-containing protein [Pontibacter pudoricolor]|uniref:PA14 domain-containing protein n=1 Tax=Pontibacter pudoricolor TaxID=2694930 RepID=UPI001390CD2C|nr:PA14 domain-containing protein [Pontibacter pudoricolor]